MIASSPATPWALRTKTIVATIAPGPASSGVPSGTSATFTSRTSVGVSVRPVSNSSATRRSSKPPAPCRAGRVIPR